MKLLYSMVLPVLITRSVLERKRPLRIIRLPVKTSLTVNTEGILMGFSRLAHGKSFSWLQSAVSLLDAPKSYTLDLYLTLAQSSLLTLIVYREASILKDVFQSSDIKL